MLFNPMKNLIALVCVAIHHINSIPLRVLEIDQVWSRFIDRPLLLKRLSTTRTPATCQYCVLGPTREHLMASLRLPRILCNLANAEVGLSPVIRIFNELFSLSSSSFERLPFVERERTANILLLGDACQGFLCKKNVSITSSFHHPPSIRSSEISLPRLKPTCSDALPPVRFNLIGHPLFLRLLKRTSPPGRTAVRFRKGCKHTSSGDPLQAIMCRRM